MAAPTKNWTSIADTSIDADSPLDTTLITAVRDDLENLKSQLLGESGAYTAAQGHDHDGVNSKEVAGVADNAISGAKIAKTPVSTGTVDIGSQLTYTPAAGVYQIIEVTPGAAYLELEFFQGGPSPWTTHTHAGALSGIFYFDGSNMRIYNSNSVGTASYFYQAFQ